MKPPKTITPKVVPVPEDAVDAKPLGFKSNPLKPITLGKIGKPAKLPKRKPRI